LSVFSFGEEERTSGDAGGKVISDQDARKNNTRLARTSQGRRQSEKKGNKEKAYAESTEDAEVAEKRKRGKE
jgi:YD repeat-containing protein